jgi:hypothetical protein
MYLRIFILIFILFPLQSTASEILENKYIGFDFGGRNLKFEKGFGSILAPNGIQNNLSLYSGHHINDWAKIEVGHSFKKKITTTAEIFDEETEFGVADYIGIGDADSYSSRLDVQSYFLNIVGDWKLRDNVILSPFIGVSYVRTKFSLDIIDVDGFIPTAQDRVDLNFETKTNKWLARGGLSLLIYINPSVGAKFGATFENTKKIKMLGSRFPTLIPQNTILQLKNSMTVSFGMFFEI